MVNAPILCLKAGLLMTAQKLPAMDTGLASDLMIRINGRGYAGNNCQHEAVTFQHPHYLYCIKEDTKIMKKLLSALLVSVIALSLLAGCSNGNSEQPAAGLDEEYTLVLANGNPPGDVKDLAAIKFAELCEEKSNGKIKVEVYSGGTLGDWHDTIEGLAHDMNDIVLESVGSCESWSRTAALESMPYTIRDLDHFLAVWNGEVGQEILDIVGQEGNFKLLGPMYRGPRVVTSKKEIRSLEDFKGLKIRIPNGPVFHKFFSRIGTTPTPLALSETFTALQQNTVEAQDNPVVESYNWGFYETCKYVIETNHMYGVDIFIFDRDKFNSFPEDVQAILEEAAAEAAAYRNQLSIDLEEEYKQKWEDEGCEIIQIDTTVLREVCEGFVEQEFPDLAPLVAKMEAAK